MPNNNPSSEFERNMDKAVEKCSTALYGVAVSALAIFWEGVKRIDTKDKNTYTYGPMLVLSTATLVAALGDTAMEIPWTATWGASLAVTVFAVPLVLGIKTFREKKAFQDAIDGLGFKTATDRKPKVASIEEKEGGRRTLRVLSYGIGPESYRRRIDDLQSCTPWIIGGIKRAENPLFVEIEMAKRGLPEKVLFEDLEGSLRGQGGFLIGKGGGGILQEKIAPLPHLMIAGTTGGGKSVFFKQALLGLLASTDGIQMYLIDLKGGLEFRAFAALPNVEAVKTPSDAVAVLEAIKDEMEARFRYLEANEKDKIVPGRDGFDRIVVAIDEASVLYSVPSKDAEDYGEAVRARNLTEHISKLSRAAGIHLIMATQRVTKETIDTRTQENISARMCFKLNTLEGSLRILGDKRACDLPSVPGRGIWQFGNETAEVQAPWIDEGAMAQRLGSIGRAYEKGEKKLRRPMLAITASVAPGKTEEAQEMAQAGGQL